MDTKTAIAAATTDIEVGTTDTVIATGITGSVDGVTAGETAASTRRSIFAAIPMSAERSTGARWNPAPLTSVSSVVVRAVA
ncbi:hypothetical protein ASF60_17550 [Methylobacterium sp. Leaf113]|nr:hypothetical protein ASF60_17550 [Methylobacterium sp. Leaf113]